MIDQDPLIAPESRLNESEPPFAPRGAGSQRAENSGRKAIIDPQPVKIVVNLGPAESQEKNVINEAAAAVLPPPAEPPAGRHCQKIADISKNSPVSTGAQPDGPPLPPRKDPLPRQIPARMLNEFVYCQRLFYYEFVDRVFVESVDTLRGGAIHKRVDAGNGALPKAKKKTSSAPNPESESRQKLAAPTSAQTPDSEPQKSAAAPAEEDIIHSRSVQLSSERLGVIAKMDLVEVVVERPERPNSPPSIPPSADPTITKGAPSPVIPKRTGRAKNKHDGTPDLFSQDNGVNRGGDGSSPAASTTPNIDQAISSPQSESPHGDGGDKPSPPRLTETPDAKPQTQKGSPSALEVCPVDYKAGAPKAGEDANELWDTDKMQLGLQALILRDNGYTCNAGVIYYRATKQRVRLLITDELERWIEQQIAEARRIITGPIPAPLVHSPKCARCSLAPVCLPDETRMLAESPAEAAPAPAADTPRRLMAARDDNRALYLNTQGYRVGCKNEVLQVKDGDAMIEEVRMRDVSQVALFGNIQISTQAIQSLCEMEIPVTYFSLGGWFYGITRGHTLKNVFLRMEQFRLARDEAACLSLARQFVHGKIRNHRTLLMRNHVEPPEVIIGKLKRASEDALEAKSIEELLGMEGAAASQYFQQFNGMVKVEDDNLPGFESPAKDPQQPTFNFNFTSRNRHPPTDPVNAMLSLAYSMLAKDCTLAVLAVGFDPYVGFYHQPRFGRPALALDIMEEFRPLVAESTVLSCINKRVITEKDFVRAGPAVNLTAPGRKRFFQTYEQRMCSLITHPLFDYKVSYRRALELQARLLAKTLTGEIAEYTPFMTR